MTCVGTTTNCTACLSTYKLYGTTCIDICPTGTYDGTVVGVNNVVCLNCTSPCLTCSTAGSNCTLCASPYYLWSYQCVSLCPAETYANSTTRTC